jgi:hypothetical protein
MKIIITEEQADTIKRIKVMERFIDQILSDHDWYEGIDSVKVEEFRTSKYDKNPIPLYVFYIITNDDVMAYNYSSKRFGGNEITEDVDDMFLYLFPYKDNKPSATWVFRFVRSENYYDKRDDNTIQESVMDKFIESMIPQLNNLKRKSNHSARMYGANTIYYDKSNGEYYFRVSEPRRVLGWSYDSNYNDSKVDWVTKPKTLHILTDLYNEITEFIPNKEMILKWFNEKYKQNAEEIEVRHSLKER